MIPRENTYSSIRSAIHHVLEPAAYRINSPLPRAFGEDPDAFVPSPMSTRSGSPEGLTVVTFEGPSNDGGNDNGPEIEPNRQPGSVSIPPAHSVSFAEVPPVTDHSASDQSNAVVSPGQGPSSLPLVPVIEVIPSAPRDVADVATYATPVGEGLLDQVNINNDGTGGDIASLLSFGSSYRGSFGSFTVEVVAPSPTGEEPARSPDIELSGTLESSPLASLRDESSLNGLEDLALEGQYTEGPAESVPEETGPTSPGYHVALNPENDAASAGMDITEERAEAPEVKPPSPASLDRESMASYTTAHTAGSYDASVDASRGDSGHDGIAHMTAQ